MYIREIHINKFRHLEDVHLGPFSSPPNQSDLIVLAGPNAGGKSSVLELLGYALSNSWSLAWQLSRSFPSNSFEVAIGVTLEERELVRQYVASAGTKYADEVLRYFQENGVYYRAYNYEGGKYQENASLHNQIHNLVTAALRNHYKRSLGFFLKSDRSYPAHSFRRERLFEYAQMTTLDYIWSTAFNTSEVQYRDMFEFLAQQRFHYFRRLGAYLHRLQAKAADPGGIPSDPLSPYAELLQKLFPSYRFVETDEEVPTNLFVQLPSGEVVPFSDLSSGEKEVFFVLSFFLRHDVTNAVIVIDEPELHLHPQFARLLVRTMQSIRPGNQVWLATHNTEIIDEAGRDRVVYLARDTQTGKSIVTLGRDEEAALRQLKDLFGYSGYIGIAKSIVFLEGLDSSSDRKVFSSLFPEYGSKVKFVPCRSTDSLTRINAAVLAILESNLGWMQFYLIRDRDFLTTEATKKYRERFAGRMLVLSRYHIENYLLDEELIARVQAEIFARPTDSGRVKQRLRSIARNIAGEVLRDMVAFRLNLLYRPEDFSLGKFLEGQPVLDSAGEWVTERIELLKGEVNSKASNIANDLQARTSPDALQALISECQREVHQALGDGDGWVSLFPGRRLLQEYVKLEGLGINQAVVLQNSLIKELSANPDRVPDELRQAIRTIDSGENFAY